MINLNYNIFNSVFAINDYKSDHAKHKILFKDLRFSEELNCKQIETEWRSDCVKYKIFSNLRISDWINCQLVSKEWRNATKNLHPLISIIKDKNSTLIKLKSIFEERACVKMQVKGTYLPPNVDYTPYLCAKDHSREDLANYLKEKEGRFSDKFIANRLLSLRFQFGSNFNIEGKLFEGCGLDHFTHHTYLMPELVNSLKLFFNNFQDSKFWTEKESEKLIKAFEANHCLSCNEVDFTDQNSLFITSALVRENKHWINFVISFPYIAIANRGAGCGNFSGIKVYKKEFKEPKDLITIYDKDENGKDPSRLTYLKLNEQLAGSCSRTSLEAALLGAIFFILQKKHPAENQGFLIKEARIIFESWWRADHTLSLHQIMKHDILDYDFSLLARVFAVYNACEKTSEEFYSFLNTKGGGVDWKAKDSDGKAFNDYVIDRKNDLLKKNKDFIISIVDTHPHYFNNVVEAIKKDRNFVLAAVKKNGMILKYLEDFFKEDEEIVRTAIQQAGIAIKFAHKKFKKDREFVLLAVQQNGLALGFLEDFCDDEEVVKTAIQQAGEAIVFAHKKFKKNREFVLLAVQQNGSVLLSLSEEYRRDKEIVLIAVKKQGEELEYADKSLKQDRDVVIAAITQNPNALEFADGDLKKDREIVLISIKQDISAFRVADQILLKDKEIALLVNKDKALLSVKWRYSLLEIAEKYGSVFLEDEEVVLAVVSLDGMELKYADQTLKSNKKIVLAAVSENFKALEFADEILKQDKDIILAADKQNK